MLPTLLLTAAIPAVVAAVFLSLAVMTREEGAWRRGGACGALAIGFAYLIGHAGASPAEALEHLPSESSNYALVLAPLALVAGLLESTFGRAAPLRWILRLGFMGAAGLAVYCSLAEPEAGTWLQLTLAGGLGIIYLLGLDGLANDRRTLSITVGLVAVTGACAVVIGVAGSAAGLAQFCSVLAAALVGVAFMTWRYPSLKPLHGAVAPLGLLTWLLGLQAFALGTLPPGSGALLAFLPVALWLGAVGRFGKVAPGNSFAAGAVVTGLLAVAAAGMAYSPSGY